MTSGMCPRCGFNLTADAPLVSGEWRLYVGFVLRNGVLQKISGQQVEVLYTIAKAGGRVATNDAIINRLGTDAEDALNLVKVLIHRIRRQIPSIPIETVRAQGYRWTDEIHVAAEL